jgi:predicted ArsR family transcriptional regulator
MCTRCWTRILRAMRRTCPEPMDLEAVCRHTGLDESKVRRELWGLVDHGYVEVQGSPSWFGLPWSVARLTETGIAVAFGLVSVEDDARGVIALPEAATLRELDRLTKQRSNRFAATRRESTSRVDAYRLRRVAPRAETHPANDAYFTRGDGGEGLAR